MTTPRDPGLPPGNTEMSWGPRLMPHPEDEPPSSYHALKAASQTNRHSEDAIYEEDVVREWYPPAAT